ncbi:MAG: radical SAM protein [Candidatus Nanoarchaeia archaeon]|nr:radical SAM protein [Candidatus Nanoarchaeia archaeon]
MKVFLLNPPPVNKGKFVKEGRCQSRAGGELWPPVTLGIIAALLKKNKYEIKCIDGTAENLSLEDIETISKDFDISVINSTTVTFFDDIEVAKAIKKANSNIKIIFYGTHVTALPEETLKYDEVDFVVRNDPELIVLNLLNALKNKEDLKNIKGISFKDKGKIINNSGIDFSYNLDELPFPALEYFPNEKYTLPNSKDKFTVVRTSRGCPSQCVYCTSRVYYGNKWRTRSVKNVLEEIRRDVNIFGIKTFLFNSDTFNVRDDWVLELCNGIMEIDKSIRWMCNSRSDTFIRAKDNTLKAMKESGCWLISFGFESGDENMLRRMKKGATLEMAEQAVNKAKQYGFETIGYFMFGLPGETKETIKNTINFAKKINPTYVRFFKAVPFPGTEFYTEAESNNWIKSRDWSRYDQADCDVYELDNISSKEMVKELRKAYLSFYLRPGYALSQIKGKSIPELGKTVVSGIKFLKEWALP